MAEIVCGGRDEVREGGLARGGGGEVERERKRKGGRRKKNLTFFLTPPKNRTQSDAFSSALRSLGPTKPTPDVRTPRYEAVVAGGADE